MADLFDQVMELLRGRKLAYQQTFETEAGRKVMADLARFCRANRSTGHADPQVAARLDGRREVFLRICEHLNLSQEELFRLYGGVGQKNPGE